MDKQTLVALRRQFDMILQTAEEEGVEFWYARDLMPLLGYSRWENFETAIK
jgi:DNA-damage-inducible protein D